METTINALTLKALMLSVITEIKFGQPLAPNAKGMKKFFKESVGLGKNASNMDVLKEIKRVYEENKLQDDFQRVLTKFNIEIK